jgi:perosamine synthetase
MSKKIYVAEPYLGGSELKYLASCVERNWFTMGPMVQRFEQEFARFVGVRHAIACSSGTVSLHLALLAIGLQEGDEVIVPDLTFVATGNVVKYCNATPVLCDILPDTWCLDAVEVRKKITPRTKAIIAVHLYGHPCYMPDLQAIADRHRLVVVEDAAEAIGAAVNGKKVGNLSLLGSFSFYGNKIITTGEGGIVTTDDGALAARVRHFRDQGMLACRRYWHDVLGYNYRMTDLQAAVGCAQMEIVEQMVERRRNIARRYNALLSEVAELQLPVEMAWATNVYWLYSVVLKTGGEQARNRVMALLEQRGVETRPFFYPLHAMPPFQKEAEGCSFPVSARVSSHGLSLPSHGNLTDEQLEYVAAALKDALQETLAVE